MRAEQNIQIASDLYEARRCARFLLRDSYDETLHPYRELISRVMKDKSLSVLQAAIDIGQRVPPSDAIPMMCVLAAAVELIESPQLADAVDPVVANSHETSTREKDDL